MTFPSYGEMCDQILVHANCPLVIREAFPDGKSLFDGSPGGEMWPIFNLWLRVVQPTLTADEPYAIGAMRGPMADGHYEHWSGEAWI